MFRKASTKYLPLAANTSKGDLERERKKDVVSHFVLRLAFCGRYVNKRQSVSVDTSLSPGRRGGRIEDRRASSPAELALLVSTLPVRSFAGVSFEPRRPCFVYGSRRTTARRSKTFSRLSSSTGSWSVPGHLPPLDPDLR
jgi:hypothetical protein